jgi:hypothetical protein
VVKDDVDFASKPVEAVAARHWRIVGWTHRHQHEQRELGPFKDMERVGHAPIMPGGFRLQTAHPLRRPQTARSAWARL